MTPLLVVVILLSWFALAVVVCLAVCVMSSRFTAREERRVESGSGVRRTPALLRESGPSPERVRLF